MTSHINRIQKRFFKKMLLFVPIRTIYWKEQGTRVNKFSRLNTLSTDLIFEEKMQARLMKMLSVNSCFLICLRPKSVFHAQPELIQHSH